MGYWVYFDASALVKRYSVESGTPFINEVFRDVPAGHRICLALTFLEVVSILVRKKNDGRILNAFFRQAMINLRREVLDDEQIFILPVDDSVVLTSTLLIEKHNLNAMDAILLLSAIETRNELLEKGSNDQLLLLTSDKRMVRAARAEGLLVLNPETDSWTGVP